MRSFVIIISILLSTVNTYSQHKFYVEAGFDPKMLIVGPYEESPGALDLMLRGGVITKNIELGLYGEIFDYTGFYSWGFQAAYPYKIWSPKKADLPALSFVVGLEAGMIFRPDYESTTGTFGINLIARWEFEKRWGINFIANFKSRSDLKKIYDDSNNFRYNGYLTLFYKFKGKKK